jgi:hypothetical protein
VERALCATRPVADVNEVHKPLANGHDWLAAPSARIVGK